MLQCSQKDSGKTDKKDILPESQAGFQKGKSTMDNIYSTACDWQRRKREESSLDSS